MANEFLNKTGLTYLWGRITALFATKTEVGALEDRVDDIVETGGEPNKIDSISLNGTVVTPDTNKKVSLTESDPTVPSWAKAASKPTYTASEVGALPANTSIPSKVSELTNDGDGTSGSKFATESYVNTNGGKIDVIQVNGTAQTITNKTVNIAMPTKVSQLTNDGDGTTGSKFATQAYVDTNGGKIDVIKVNGTSQTITNKAVDISVPTKVSQLTNDSNFQTATQVTSAINAAVASAYKYKGSVATTSDLPASGNTVGDVYDVQSNGVNYAWNGTAWDALGQVIDLSTLWAKSELTAITTAEIDTITA